MKILFFETVKSKVIISLFETVRLSVSISPRNLYNSLKSIKENGLTIRCMDTRSGEAASNYIIHFLLSLLMTIYSQKNEFAPLGTNVLLLRVDPILEDG